MGLAQPKPDPAPASPTIHVLPAPTAPAAAPAAPKRRGKLDLGGISTAPASSKSTTTYPTAVLTDEQKEMVSELLTQMGQFKALEASIKSAKAEINEIVLPQWIEKSIGQLEPASSMIVPGTGTDTGMLTIAGDTGGRYNGTDEAAAVDQLADLVGEEHFATAFTEKVTLKVELDKIAEDKQQALVTDLLKVFEVHGASHAVTAKNVTTFQPLARKARFQLFDLPTNLAIHRLLPIIPSFKARS